MLPAVIDRRAHSNDVDQSFRSDADQSEATQGSLSVKHWSASLRNRDRHQFGTLIGKRRNPHRRVPDRTDHTETLPPDIDFALFSSYNLL